MRGGALVVAMVTLLGTVPCNAFDPSGVDIIGLRLGMPEAQIVLTMRQQGFAVAHDHGALIATTRDGRLTVDLTDDRTAARILYVFAGRGNGEPDKIRASVIDRFGPPAQAKPMRWCEKVGSDGLCPDTAASLMFAPESLSLLLRAGVTLP